MGILELLMLDRRTVVVGSLFLLCDRVIMSSDAFSPNHFNMIGSAPSLQQLRPAAALTIHPSTTTDDDTAAANTVDYNYEDDDDNDPNAIDPDMLGIYTDEDFNCKTEYEWDEDDEDPNIPNANVEYVESLDVNDEGVEIGWTPIFGPSNPIDTRTVITPAESYMVDPKTRNESMLSAITKKTKAKSKKDTDVETDFNDHVTALRKSMKIVDTYTDPWLNQEVPRHVAKWYGYPEQTSFPKKPFSNNRFTEEKDKTDFTKLDPYRARKKAVEMARSHTNEWLPEGKSEAYRLKKRQVYIQRNELLGSLKPGKMDKKIVKRIQPCLKVLGQCVELLEIRGENNTVFRFHYYGLMKNRRGMQAWTETMIRDCGVDCTGVVFETGDRMRDMGD